MDITRVYRAFQVWLVFSSSLIIEYFFITVLLFLIFFAWKKKSIWFAHIQQKHPDNKHVKREVIYSFISSLIMGAAFSLMNWIDKHQCTLVYKPIDKYGWGYYTFSIIVMVILHDAYYYWLHRFLHWGPMFKYVHKVHHMSTNPTPFAAYCFHPVEQLLQIMILFAIDFTIPHHQSAILVFGAYSLIINIYGHLGFELFSKKVIRHKVFKWFNTSTHHNMHHTNVKSNLGLYFNFWDWAMKTNDKGYHAHFEKVTERRDTSKAQSKAANGNSDTRSDVQNGALAQVIE